MGKDDGLIHGRLDLTAEERDLVRMAAVLSGYRSAAAWARVVVVEQARAVLAARGVTPAEPTAGRKRGGKT